MTFLTEVGANSERPAQHHVLDEEVEMAEDDERWRSSGAAVVLFNELVSLKLPYFVCVVLHFLECKAVEKAHRG